MNLLVTFTKILNQARKDVLMLGVASLVQLVYLSKSPRLRAGLAGLVGWLAFLFWVKKKRRMYQRLTNWFGAELTAGQRRTIGRQAIQVVWQEVFNCPPFVAGEAAPARAQFDGLPHVAEALAAGRGLILVESSGFGHRAGGKQLLFSKGISVHTVHAETHMWGLGGGRPFTWVRRRLVQPMFESLEKKYVAEVIYLPTSAALGYARHLLRLLKDNAIVCVSGDGRTGKNLVELRFLDRQARFTTGVISLARITGSPVLPIFCYAEPDGALRLIIEPPLELDRDSEREHMAADGMSQYARRLEGYVRRFPGQYRYW